MKAELVMATVAAILRPQRVALLLLAVFMVGTAMVLEVFLNSHEEALRTLASGGAPDGAGATVDDLRLLVRGFGVSAIVLFAALGVAVCRPTGRRLRHEIAQAQDTASSAEESRRQMEDFARASSDWFWEKDADLRFSHLSERFRWMTGMDPADFLGRTRRDIADHDEDGEQARRHGDDLEARRPFRDFRYSVRSQDGSLRHLRMSGVPAFDTAGRFTGYRGTGADITAQVETARQRDRLLAFQTGVLNGAANAIIATDSEGRITLFNRTAERLLGYGATELVGIATPELFHDPVEVAVRARELSMAAGFDVFVAPSRGGPPEKREWTYIRKDGSRVPVSLSISTLRDGGGAITGYLGIASDITERRAAEAELRAGEARLRAIFETVVDGIITIDDHGVVETLNPAAIRLFGYPAEEVLGRNVSMLMPEPHQAAHDGYLAAYLRTGEAKVIGIGREVSGRRKDGGVFPVDLAVSEVRLGDRRLFTGVIRDITERKRLDQLKTEFVATVSHELRTPLTSIKGSLALIVQGVAGDIPPKAATLLEIADRNCNRLMILINDILDMEKMEAGRIEFSFADVDIATLLDHAVEASRDYARQLAVSFAVTPPVAPLRVSGDFDRLMQVMANLLSNAAKVSPEGGMVEVSAEPRDAGVRIAVADRGAGIPAEFRSRIFGKFAQADATDTRQKGGTGLGLAIARSIIERHGGVIGFEDRVGGGTCFYVNIPLLNDA